MFYTEYGDRSKPSIVLLHGANFTDIYVNQYALSEQYHLILPHITGFGQESETVFTTKKAVSDIVALIHNLNKKVYLVGFSLGAQLCFRIVMDYPELVKGVIFISPWLIKKKENMNSVIDANLREVKMMKNKFLCRLQGRKNGMSKEIREIYVEQMQKVKLETVRNFVNNGIELATAPSFADIEVPMLALAGEHESDDVRRSVTELATMNRNCQCEIWENAAHNIPPVFSERLNCTIEHFINKIGNRTK